MRRVLRSLIVGFKGCLKKATIVVFSQNGIPPQQSEQTKKAKEAAELLDSGVQYLQMFEQDGDPVHLDTAIDLLQQTLGIQSALHPLITLATALTKRFWQQGCLSDLDKAIDLHREALKLHLATHPNRFVPLNNLANGLCARFEHTSHLSDLEEAIGLHREALKLHPDRFMSLNNLAGALFTLFMESGHGLSLEESIALQREALELRPTPNSDRSCALDNLATALCTQFQHQGDLPDLDEAILLHRQALVLHPNPPVPLNNLATALVTRFQKKGDIPDLEEAIKFHREALGLYSSLHPGRSMSLSNLANALYGVFEQKGHLPDLEEAVSLHREALMLRPPPHSGRATSPNSLANALYGRFQQKGHISDLEESISLHREALKLRSPPHPNRSTSLNNLSVSLRKRFFWNGHLPDLEESISLQREVLELHHDSHPDRALWLHNLAIALSTLSQRKHHLPSIEEAISLLREVLLLHPDRSIPLNNLAAAIYIRFQQTGHLPDLEEAITLYRDLMNFLPPNHPRRFRGTNLGLALITLYAQSRNPDQLEEGIKALREGASSVTAPLLNQFKSARQWAHHAGVFNHPSAQDAFKHVINLLPSLSSVDMTLQQRQTVLTEACGFASEACSWAICAGQIEKAVEFLSSGRAVFWSQGLHLRTPLDELQAVAPEFAERLRTISADLDYSTRVRDPELASTKFSRVQDIEKEASRCRLLNEERVCILTKVRRISGFEDFMLPKSFAKLQGAASNGAIVMLSTTDMGGDGLLITTGGVKHIPLPHLKRKQVSALRNIIQGVLSDDCIDSAVSEDVSDILKSLKDERARGSRFEDLRKAIRVPSPGCSPDDLFCLVLEILWFNIARPVIDALNLKVSDSPPRLWWCPTGPFSFLPIHAAGVYKDGPLICLADYAVSSYIPTLDALLNPPPAPSEDFAMFPVIEAGNTAGLPYLQYAQAELEVIQKHVPQDWLQSISNSSPEYVSSLLLDASSVHFACHGLQDSINPLDSALFLRGGRLTMSKIMEKPLPKAMLAFLSACETAKGDDDIPDEVIHLSASLLFAGFRGVVGTMWSIYDADAPLVADVFYGHLFRKGKDAYPDPTDAAYALHLAVKKLRMEKVNFKRWIPFIHLGI